MVTDGALRFYHGASSSEMGRFDSSGRLGIGTSAPASDATLHVDGTDTVLLITEDSEGDATLRLGDTQGDLSQSMSLSYDTGSANALKFIANGTSERMRIDSSGNLLVGTTSVPSQNTGVSSGVYFVVKGDIIPSVDAGLTGHSDLGDPSTRYEDAYIRDGVTTGSDANDKQDIETLSDAEQRVAAACKGLLRKWRWIDAVEAKGDDARIHFGIIAQDLEAAFTAEGLDAGRYGMFISSTWTDDDGNEQTRLGVRYSELLAFIISAI